MTEGTPDIDALVAELAATVEERRRSGDIPADLDEQLESRFASLRREAQLRQDFRPLHEALERQQLAGGFSRERIPIESERAGGAAVHKATSALVRRQIDGVLGQMQDFSAAVQSTTELLGDMLSDPPFHHHDDLRGDLDMIDARVTDLERARVELDVLARQVADVHHVLERVSAGMPELDRGSFVSTFRGSTDELAARYGPLADRLVGAGPVVDVGCGRGDFLTLLADRGVEAWGVEADAAFAELARERGHRVRLADGVEAVRNLADGSLGAVVLLHVVEHLSPRDLVEIVHSARRVLRPGGLLVVEAPDPRSMFVHTHSLWLDPGHSRPVHPLYVEFLCREAGFAEVELSGASPVPDAERLRIPEGADGATAALASLVEQLNAVLFGSQDARVVATA